MQRQCVRSKGREAGKVASVVHKQAVPATALAPGGDAWCDGTLLRQHDGLLKRAWTGDERAGVAGEQIHAWLTTAAEHCLGLVLYFFLTLLQ